jgi:hypothetical protein
LAGPAGTGAGASVFASLGARGSVMVTPNYPTADAPAIGYNPMGGLVRRRWYCTGSVDRRAASCPAMGIFRGGAACPQDAGLRTEGDGVGFGVWPWRRLTGTRFGSPPPSADVAAHVASVVQSPAKGRPAICHRGPPALDPTPQDPNSGFAPDPKIVILSAAKNPVTFCRELRLHPTGCRTSSAS